MGFIDKRWVPLLTDLPKLLGLGVGCVVLLMLSHQLWPFGDAPVPRISLISGLGLAGLLMGGNRLWPGIGAGMVAGLMLEGVSVPAALGIALGSTMGALAGSFLVRQRDTNGIRLDGLKDYLSLILLGALPASLTSAIFTSLTLSLGGVLSLSHLPRTLAFVWQGDFLGALLVGPLLLCLRPPWSWPPHLNTRRGQWSIAVFFLIALLLLATLSLPVSRVLLHLFSRPYIIYPLVIWAAFSLGRRGTGLLCLLMVSLLEALPQGREVLIIAPFDEQTLHRWLSGSFICLTGMGMATLFHERRAISASLAKSRQELAASEATFRSLAQSSALMVWISDSQGRLTWINDTWRRFTGSDTPSLHTRHWLKNVPKEDWERIKNIHRVSMATRSPFELEFRLRDARGDLRWMSASSAPRFASDGEFLGYCGSCQDITELKQATQDARDKEHLLRNIFDASGAGIFTLDEDSRLTHANRRMAEMFGIPTERLLGTSYFDLVAPEDEAASRGNYVRLFRGESAEVDRRYQRSDNTCFWGHASVRPIIDEGRFQGIVGTIIDVSAQHEAMEKLNLAAKVFESSNEGVLICDAKNNIVSVNRAFSEITGYQTEEVIGRNPRLFASGRHPVAFYEAMWGALAREGNWSGEVWNRRKDGRIYPEWLSITVLKDSKGKVLHYIALIQDITQRKDAEARIRYLAQYDYLTDLPNRALLFDRLNQLHASALRYGKRYAVLFIDLDNFKPVNDAYGHDAGDALLRQVAQRLRDNVRAADTVARHGGDEFVVLAPEIQQGEEVVTLAQKLAATIAQPYRIDGLVTTVSTSIGVALYPEDGEDVDTLMRKADAAMYRAKAAGRNTIAYASPLRERES